jgi:glutathione S-transferase
VDRLQQQRDRRPHVDLDLPAAGHLAVRQEGARDSRRPSAAARSRARFSRSRAPQKEDAAVEALKKTFGVLDKVLESRTFLVGNGVTLADIVMACNLSPGFKSLFDEKFRSAFPSLQFASMPLSSIPPPKIRSAAAEPGDPGG